MDLEELTMILETIEARIVPDDDFEEIAKKAGALKNLDDENRLLFYGLYKQATVGDVNVKAPWAIEFVARAKWDKWNAFKGFPKNSARLCYIFMYEKWSETASDESNQKSGGSAADGNLVTVSTLENFGDDGVDWAASETIFKAVVDNNMDQLRMCMNKSNINSKDKDGLAPLHFAADRGHADVALELIGKGADINAVDKSGQTALMYAIGCEQVDVVKVLLEAGADTTIKNEDGENVFELGDVPENIAVLLAPLRK